MWPSCIIDCLAFVFDVLLFCWSQYPLFNASPVYPVCHFCLWSLFSVLDTATDIVVLGKNSTKGEREDKTTVNFCRPPVSGKGTHCSWTFQTFGTCMGKTNTLITAKVKHSKNRERERERERTVSFCRPPVSGKRKHCAWTFQTFGTCMGKINTFITARYLESEKEREKKKVYWHACPWKCQLMGPGLLSEVIPDPALFEKTLFPYNWCDRGLC